MTKKKQYVKPHMKVIPMAVERNSPLTTGSIIDSSMDGDNSDWDVVGDPNEQ